MAVSHPHMPATTETPVDRTEAMTPLDARGDDTSVGKPESFHVGMSDRLGRYADAIRLPAHTVQVLTSGTPGLTPTGAIPETFEAEAQQAWANVRKALLAAGACLRDVVSVRAWLTDPSDIPAYERASAWFVDHQVVTSVVVVSQLRRPGMRVQVDVVAAPSAGSP
jgi:enamine deaminase RidA (YjgF/YER057c/UK114 family)